MVYFKHLFYPVFAAGCFCWNWWFD